MKDWIFVFLFLVCIGFVSQAAYQQGYDQAKAECRAPIDMKIKPMTYKQQVRHAIWSMRDKGWIK